MRLRRTHCIYYDNFCYFRQRRKDLLALLLVLYIIEVAGDIRDGPIAFTSSTNGTSDVIPSPSVKKTRRIPLKSADKLRSSQSDIAALANVTAVLPFALETTVTNENFECNM